MRKGGMVWALTSAVALAGLEAGGPQKPEKPNPEIALGCMRSINTAEVVYDKTYGKGFSPTLRALGVSSKNTPPTRTAAGLLDDSLTGGKKAGYVFVYKSGAPDKSGRIRTYIVVARPVKWEEGLRSLFTDESAIIRGTTENREANVHDQPL